MRTHIATFLCLLLTLAAALPAQLVRVANFSGSTVTGWVRATTDWQDAPTAGVVQPDDTAPAVRYVLGRRIGLDARTIDLRLELAAGEVATVDLRHAKPLDWAHPLNLDRGDPVVAGTQLHRISSTPDGAGFLEHWRARLTAHLVADLWLVVYADTGWARGELVVCASTTAPHEPTAALPQDLTLRWPGAVASVPGAPSSGLGPLLTREDVRIADGQARSWPLVVVWPRLLQKEDWAMASANLGLGIAANGIGRLWPQGNPRLPAGASPLAWTHEHLPDALASLHRWAPPRRLGVAAYSRQTGNQEDQVFVGAELAGTAGLGAETVRYLVALAQSRRPCQFREPSGELLQLDRHPQLNLWDGAPHWDHRQSPDRLGRSRSPTATEASNWYGPDVEHWLMGTLCLAYHVTGSPALQQQIDMQARLYLLQWTIDSRLATTNVWIARAIGWEGLGVVLLWHRLEDRVLAAAVRDRWLARLDRVLLPRLARSDIWDVRRDDPRLGKGDWWFPWQQSVGVYGLDLAGRTFGRADARAAAHRGALRVVQDGWRQANGRWSPIPQKPVDGDGALNDSWTQWGMPLGVATVLLNDPAHEKARSVWAQILRESGGGGPWLPPELFEAR